MSGQQICYFGGYGSQTEELRRPRRTWKEVMDKDVNDLHTEL